MPYYRSVTNDAGALSVVSSGVGYAQVAAPAGSLTNFPMRFAGIYPWLATVANGGRVTSNTGLDIFFASDDQGINKLNFERVAYNPTNGAVEFFVNIPTLNANTTGLGTGPYTVIYIFYGYANPTDLSDPAAVWPTSSYAGVYHFGDGTALNLNDSTANGNNGTNYGAVLASGLLLDNTNNHVGGAIQLSRSGMTYVNLGNAIQPSGSVGVLAFINATSIPATGGNALNRGIVGNSQEGTAGFGVYQCNSSAPGSPLAIFQGSGNNIESIHSLPLGDNWEDATLETNPGICGIGCWINPGSSDKQIGILIQNTEDGILSGDFGSGLTSSPVVPGGNTLIGNDTPNADYFDGYIDEIQIITDVSQFYYIGFSGGYNFASPMLIALLSNYMQSETYPFYVIGAENFIAQVVAQCNNPPNGEVGIFYTHTFTASGGIPPYTFSITAGSLPPGITLNSSTGIASGTPTSTGTYNFTVTATDSASNTGSVNCTIIITQSPFPTPSPIQTLRFEIPKKRWFPHSYADTIAVHYLDEVYPTNVDNLQLLMLSSDQGFIYRDGGDTDVQNASNLAVPINSFVTTPSMDGGDDRVQKLYIDVMNDVDQSGLLQVQSAYNNQTVAGASFAFINAGPRTQYLANISSLASLNLYRNIALQYAWTGGPDGPRLYVSEPSGYVQPYISTFFVTQIINLAFPGWKHHRRLYAGYISNSTILFKILTQDGRLYGPYSLPSTGGIFKIVPLMLDQNIKDLAFAYQIDGQGQNFAMFPEAFTIETKEWREPDYIHLAIFRT